MTIHQKINYLQALAELFDYIDREIEYKSVFDGETDVPPTEDDYRYDAYCAWKTLREKAEKLLMI